MSKFIQKAIKHPGIEIEKAKRNGVSTHEQLEKDSHSNNASVRGRGELGLRFEGGGDLHKHADEGGHRDGHTTSGMDKALQEHVDKHHPVKR